MSEVLEVRIDKVHAHGQAVANLLLGLCHEVVALLVRQQFANVRIAEGVRRDVGHRRAERPSGRVEAVHE